jgi:hypothetical protein
MEALGKKMDRLYSPTRRLGVKPYLGIPIEGRAYQASTRAFAIFS